MNSYNVDIINEIYKYRQPSLYSYVLFIRHLNILRSYYESDENTYDMNYIKNILKPSRSNFEERLLQLSILIMNDLKLENDVNMHNYIDTHSITLNEYKTITYTIKHSMQWYIVLFGIIVNLNLTKPFENMFLIDAVYNIINDDVLQINFINKEEFLSYVQKLHEQ